MGRGYRAVALKYKSEFCSLVFPGLVAERERRYVYKLTGKYMEVCMKTGHAL